MIKLLQNSYSSRYGVPIISRVETSIFVQKYFTYCMECTLCHDACCFWGVDVDVENAKRIQIYADALEAYIGIPYTQWFETSRPDAELPGGGCTRTQVVNGACVFLSRTGQGCLLHSFAIENDLDYHILKPMVSSLFPLTFGEGSLMPAGEVEDNSLICLGSGQTLYRGVRGELAHYFGQGLISELDEVEAATPTISTRVRSTQQRLPGRG